MVLTQNQANISFAFQAVNNISAHPTYPRFELFWIFRYIWGQIVFLKGLEKSMEIGNSKDLMLF